VEAIAPRPRRARLGRLSHLPPARRPFIVVANFAIDLIVAWMDPRAAEAGARGSTVGRIA
jgi:hypothetical protein